VLLKDKAEVAQQRGDVGQRRGGTGEWKGMEMMPIGWTQILLGRKIMKINAVNSVAINGR
jgi:hypothetical protein